MSHDLGLTLANPCIERGSVYYEQFEIGRISLQLINSGAPAGPPGPSLELFRVEVGISDITIQVEWVPSLTAKLEGLMLFDSGTTWRLCAGEDGFQFDFNALHFGKRPYKRLMVDPHFRRGSLQMSAEFLAGSSVEAWPLEYPVDELLIMHRLTQEKAIELHGCGIVKRDGVGNLFVGHSGAGKSTTTRLWNEREDVEVLSDDRIIVRRDRDTPALEMPTWAADAEKNKGILRLRNCSAPRTSCSARDDRGGDSPGQICMYGTPWHGEASFASPNSAPLSRIFVLEHGRGNVITRLSPSQAVAELFARSFVPFHRHEYLDSALEFLQDLVSVVPCYRYAFEPDERAVDRILHFHD